MKKNERKPVLAAIADRIVRFAAEGNYSKVVVQTLGEPEAREFWYDELDGLAAEILATGGASVTFYRYENLGGGKGVDRMVDWFLFVPGNGRDALSHAAGLDALAFIESTDNWLDWHYPVA